MAGAQTEPASDRYRWVALANTTAAMFMATLDGSIVIIALPAIFRGIHLDPLAPGNISYLLWMIMGYRLVQAVLVVTLGRLGDMFGRVKIYNAGFVVFTVASILLSFDPFDGGHGALWLIGWRVLRDNGERHRGRIDWWGNVTFAVGLGGVLIGITEGIQPYGSHSEGWTNPTVAGLLIGGTVLLAAFVAIERRVAEPMFQLSLFRIRAFTAGSIAGLVVAIARGGLQFMLIIWLQGIWLPLHGYDFSRTPLWAGIFLLPLTAGFLVSGPTAGILTLRGPVGCARPSRIPARPCRSGCSSR